MFPQWTNRTLQVLVALVIATTAQAEIPEQSILNELAERLTELPDCVPGCASLESVDIRMSEADALELRLVYPTGETVAVPLPSIHPATALHRVARQQVTSPLLQKLDGTRLIEIEPGNSHVSMYLNLQGLNELNITFPMEPALTRTDVCCWTVSESVESKQKSIVLKRQEQREALEQFEQSTYEFHHWVVVSRYIDLGIETTTQTHVGIKNQRDEVVSIEVPTLRGETVLDGNVALNDDRVVVQFEPNTRSISWNSSLQLSDSLELLAPADAGWSEIWYLKGSDFWQYTATGLTPSQSSEGYTLFKPRPGEKLELTLQRPVAQPGPTTTADEVRLEFKVGDRFYTGNMDLWIRSSVASEFTVTLPEDSLVERFQIDANDQPLVPGSDVKFKLLLGEHNYTIDWRGNKPIGVGWQTPEISLSSNISNVGIVISLDRDRWVLLLGGPAIGSAILFWGVVLVTVFVAVALSLLPNFPLRKTDAILFAIGATLANIWALLFVALWAVSIWWRGRMQVDRLSGPQFNSLQITLSLVSLVGAISVFLTVFFALLFPAEMFIETHHPGTISKLNESAVSRNLIWFSDASGSVLPTAWVVSLPFWIYQFTMLLWSLWLAFALVRWARITFNTIVSPTPWRTKEVNKDSSDIEGGLERQESSGSEPSPA